MIDLVSIMPLYVLYNVSDGVWLAAASRSRSMKEAIEAVGAAQYVAWMNLAKRHRPELADQMRELLITIREQRDLPRCSTSGCGRPAKARGLCKREYEVWLSSADPEMKIRRASYPADDQIVAWFAESLPMVEIARRIGVARETLRDYIERRPELAVRVEPWRVARRPAERSVLGREYLMRQVASIRADQEVRRAARRQQALVDQRVRAAERRRRDPEHVREVNRRWARNQDPAKRRHWNNYNRLRRMGQAQRLDPRQVVESRNYQSIIRTDPCVYCGGPSGTIDHVWPIKSAGGDTWDNLAPACHSCNAQKNDVHLLHYLLRRLDNAVAQGGDVDPVDLPS